MGLGSHDFGYVRTRESLPAEEHHLGRDWGRRRHRRLRGNRHRHGRGGLGGEEALDQLLIRQLQQAVFAGARIAAVEPA
eukprot:COSAG01_NODE_20616_length_945_cov_0.864066_1_plen_79_part_00